MSDKEIKEQKENNVIENIEMENMGKRNTGKWKKIANILIKIICSIAVMTILISIYEPLILKTNEKREFDCMPKHMNIFIIKDNKAEINPNPREPEGCGEEIRSSLIKDSIYYVITTIIILIFYTILMFKVKIYKTKKDIWYSIFIFILIIWYCRGTIYSTYSIYY